MSTASTHPAEAGRPTGREGRRGRLVRALFGGLLLAGGAVFPLSNADTFGHLAQGRQLVLSGTIAGLDPFSIAFEPPRAWINYEWLSDILAWGVYRAGGATGVVLFFATLCGLAGALLVTLTERQAGPRAALLCALVLGSAVPVARFRLTPRPHVFGFALGALALALGAALLRRPAAEPLRRTLPTVLAVGALQVLWVNLHGSHLTGLGICGMALGLAVTSRAGPARAPAMTASLLALAACALSPWGPWIVWDAVRHVFDPGLRELVVEWGPWTTARPLAWLLDPLVRAAVLLAGARVLWREGPSARLLLGVGLATAVLAARSLRFIAEFLLLSAPALALILDALLRRLPLPRRRVLVGAAFAALAVLVPLGARTLPPERGPGLGEDVSGLPAGCAAWLRSHSRGARVLAPANDSWFLLWAAPATRVWMDGRVPFYGPEVLLRGLDALTEPAAFERLAADARLDAVLLPWNTSPHRALVRALRARGDFVLAAVETDRALFVRNGALAIDRFEPFAALPLDYAPEAVLEATPEARDLMGRELARLGVHPNSDGYRAWVHALLALVRVAPAGARGGLSPAHTDAERAYYRALVPAFERASRATEGLAIVEVWRGLVAARACALDTAQRALDAARVEGETRESTLLEAELALARGQPDAPRELVARASENPAFRDDPWLSVLRSELRAPFPCAR